MSATTSKATKECNGVSRGSARLTWAAVPWPPPWFHRDTADAPKIMAPSMMPAAAIVEPRAAVEPAPDLSYRQTIPTWSIAWRQAWGDRANELAEAGVPWPQDEIRAYMEVAAEVEAAGDSVPGPTDPASRSQ